MFRWFSFSLMLLLAACLIAAQHAADAQNLTSFKGWELYSWKDKDTWRFSLLYGTNRNKSIEEVTDPEATMNLQQLKAQLEKLAPKEEVFWTDGLNVIKSKSAAKLQMPDAATIKEIESVCSASDVHLVFKN